MYISSGSRRVTPLAKQRGNNSSHMGRRACLILLLFPLAVLTVFVAYDHVRSNALFQPLGVKPVSGRILAAKADPECVCEKGRSSSEAGDLSTERADLERMLQGALAKLEAAGISKGGAQGVSSAELEDLRAREARERAELEEARVQLKNALKQLEPVGSKELAAQLEEARQQLKAANELLGQKELELIRARGQTQMAQPGTPDNTEEPNYVWNITNRDLIFKQGMFWIPEHPKPTLTIAVLVYREKESLLGAFASWQKAGLLQYADEVVVYFQELDDDKAHWLDGFKPAVRGELKVIGSPNNEALLAATHWAIGNATMDMILFLEKDWQVVEEPATTIQRLDEGMSLLEYEVAHVIRYRSRRKPGNPLYCQEMFQGREKKILDQQKNLMCCVHHWLDDDRLESNEFAPYIYRCPALPKVQNGHIAMFRDQKDWFCSRAEYCLWTNNPYLIRREWWRRNYKHMVDVLVHRWDEWTEHQRALDIEYLFAWNPYYWNSRAWTVAVGEGIFSHVEKAEHQEVDYKALRAEADEQDREKERLLAEAAGQATAKPAEAQQTARTAKQSGVDESSLEPFLRQATAVFEMHKVPTDESWLPHAKQALQQCQLNPKEASQHTRALGGSVKGDITLVTALLDLGRGSEQNGMFKRNMDEYFQRFQRILDRGFPMVVYMPPEFRQHLKIDTERIHLVDLTVDGLKDPALFGPYWDRVQAIRTSELWMRQGVATGWLDKAPQAVLPGYNPLVMSKPFLLQRAAHLNPFGTTFHMFLDAGHACGTELTPGEMSLFEEHMDSTMFATYWRYGTATEVHGLTDKAMHVYMGQQTDPLNIVRGGIFGGRPSYIDCFVDLYKIILQQTLDDGYMGTEENLFAIVYQRFPELFKAFDNDSRGTACDNCAAFSANLERYAKQRQRRLLGRAEETPIEMSV